MKYGFARSRRNNFGVASALPAKLTFDTTSLPAMVNGVAYSEDILTSDGLPAIVLTISQADADALAAIAMTFTDNGDGTATVAGTPDTPTTMTITVTATDGIGRVTTQEVAISAGAPAMPVTFLADFDADTNIAATGGLVDTWANSGSIAAAGCTLINNGGANRPTLVTADADFNGHNSVSFNGSNHLYDNGHSVAAAALNAGTKHCFVVMSIETYAGSRYVFRDDNARFGLRIDAGGDGLQAFNNDGSEDTTPDIAVPAVSTPCLVEVLHTGGNLSVKVGNGSYQTVASGDSGAFGSYLEVGHAADGAGTKITGKIARLILHDTVLAGQDLLDTRANLGITYGVSY